MKKVLALILICSSLLTLGGCGGSARQTVRIGIPDDGTNLSRAIKLLESAGLISVKPEAGYTPQLTDITAYLYNIEIVPTTANTLTATLEDYGASTINGTYAVPAGLVPSKDALIIEKQSEGGDNPYVNIIAARSADKDKEIYKTIVEAYHSQTVAWFLLENYQETFFPAFAYDEKSPAPAGLAAEINGYRSDSAGKTVVKVGVCGANNNQWLAVQKVLDEQNAGIYIELVEFDAYNLPNEALAQGDIDLNAFQHKAYLASEIASQGYAIEAIGDTLIAPLSLYSKKVNSLEALKNLAGKK